MILQELKKIIFLSIVILFLIIFDIGCPFHKITGLYCPGCGITRMFISIFRLDFYHAFRYNSLVFIYLILFILFKIYQFLYKKIKGKKIEIPNIVIYIFIIILLIFGILRNLEAFEFLKPIS